MLNTRKKINIRQSQMDAKLKILTLFYIESLLKIHTVPNSKGSKEWLLPLPFWLLDSGGTLGILHPPLLPSPSCLWFHPGSSRQLRGNLYDRGEQTCSVKGLTEKVLGFAGYRVPVTITQLFFFFLFFIFIFFHLFLLECESRHRQYINAYEHGCVPLAVNFI